MNRLCILGMIVFGLTISCKTTGGKDISDIQVTGQEPTEASCAGDLALESSRHCTAVLGNLELTGETQEKISKHPITQVFGDLIISSNPMLQDLEFLSSLKHVSGDLIIKNNPQLRIISFKELKSVTERVVLSGNPQLEKIQFSKTSKNSGVDRFRESSANGTVCEPG